jgi:hypothetical protein
MNLDFDGPTVQKCKKGEGRVTLTFKDVANTDKARTWINQNSQQILLKSVSVLKKTYPSIERLNGLAIKAITGAGSQIKKRLRSATIMESLQKENPSLLGHLVYAEFIKPAR